MLLDDWAKGPTSMAAAGPQSPKPMSKWSNPSPSAPARPGASVIICTLSISLPYKRCSESQGAFSTLAAFGLLSALVEPLFSSHLQRLPQSCCSRSLNHHSQGLRSTGCQVLCVQFLRRNEAKAAWNHFCCCGTAVAKVAAFSRTS